MPTASQRPTSAGKGGGATASNETPVSTAEQPDPPRGANTAAARPPRQAVDPKTANEPPTPDGANPNPAGKANGRDHPIESEHDHAHQKLNGASARRQQHTTRPT